MYKILLKVKHQYPGLWSTIAYLNGIYFGLRYGKQLHQNAVARAALHSNNAIAFRILEYQDLSALECLLLGQNEDQLEFFKPHRFDLKTLKTHWRDPSFLMMGAFLDDTLVGYFFLRCFVNKNCFIGRLVESHHQRKGIAKGMSEVMYHTAWSMGFKCLTTISKHNHAIFKLHEHERNTIVLRELPNDYLLVQILPQTSAVQGIDTDTLSSHTYP